MVKNPPANTGDSGSIPGSGKFPGEGNGNPLQYSCLENPIDGGACQATVHRVTTESDTTERLNDNFYYYGDNKSVYALSTFVLLANKN